MLRVDNRKRIWHYWVRSADNDRIWRNWCTAA